MTWTTARQFDLDLHARMRAIEDREPLMFDGEGAHGIAALYAVAVIELEAEARPDLWPVSRQAEQLEYTIEALQQYVLQLREPDCPKCGAGLLHETTNRIGHATYCPNCASRANG